MSKHWRDQSSYELAIKAAAIREHLQPYQDKFDIRVSDDTRHGGMCRTCKAFVFGSPDDEWQIVRQMEAHQCAVVAEVSK